MKSSSNQDDLMERGGIVATPMEGIEIVENTPGNENSNSVEWNKEESPDSIVEEATAPEAKPRSSSCNFKHRSRFAGKRYEQADVAKTSVTRKFEDHPSGYPRLAALLCTDDNLMLYHRFTYLQSRLLLHKQDEIRELERKLDRMDKADATKAPEILKSRELDDKNVGKRLELLSAIETKFNEYATLLTNARHITSFNNPTDEDYQSVRTYFDKGTPLREMESYIYHEEDILSLKVEIENAWLDVWLDKKIEELLDKYVLHTKYGRVLRFIFATPEFLKKTNPTKAGVILYSRGHLNKFKITIILGMIMIHFVVPVYVLWYMARLPETNSSTAVSVAILLIFTCALSLVLSQLTRAKRHEILASAAA